MNFFLPWKTSFLFLIILLFPSFHNLLAQTSAISTFPGTVALSNTASTIGWNNITQVQNEDNNFAKALITGANKTTANLDAQSWGFQSSNSALPNYIPSNAVINGIRVFVKLRKTLTGTVKDNKVVLLKNGVETGNNKAITTAVWPGNAAYVAYGDEIDNWGADLTPSDLTNSKFGLRISARNKGRKDAQAEIDHIKIIIYFNQTIYYSKSSGNLEALATWGTNPDGSGTAPANFTRNGQLFTLTNRSSAELTANLSISGTNSGLLVGNGVMATSLTIPSTYALNARVNVKENASLVITNTIIPTLDAIGKNTTITYNANADQTITDAYYYNLSLGGSGTKYFQSTAAGSITINNNLVISAGVTAHNQGNHIVIGGSSNGLTNNGFATGTGKYTYSLQDISTSLSGNGTYSNLEIDASSSSNNAATLTLNSPATIMSGLYLTNGVFASNSNVTMAPSSMIYIGEGTLNSSLSGNGYDVTYLSAGNTTLVAGNELSGLLRNLTLQVPGTTTLSLNRNLTLTGNLVLNSGTLDPNNYSITIGGDFTNHATLAARNTIFTLNGLTEQRVSGSSPLSFYHLKIQQATGSGVQLEKPATVTNTLTLSSGIISTSNLNTLTLAAGTKLTGGSASSYINGPMIREANTTTATLDFPIGKDKAFRPLTLSVTLNATTGTAFTAEVFNGAPPVRTLSAGLQNVSSVRYYTIHPDNISNISSATITLPYDTDESITNPSALRIAKSSGSSWINIGGAGTTIGSGTITSAPFYAFSDFVLANTRQSVVLPLTWVNFTAVSQASAIQLRWQTTQEVNTRDFRIEKSADGQHWTPIATLNSQNQTSNSYSYTDVIPFPVNYYRILQRDQDGQFSYSKTLRVLFQNGPGSLTLTPNRVSNGNITGVLTDEWLLNSRQARVQIFDLSGKMIYTQTSKPTPVFAISVPGLLPGRYILVMTGENKQLQTQLLVQ